MKDNTIKLSLPNFSLCAGLLGLALRIWYLTTGADKAGLYRVGHPANVLTYLLVAAVVLELFIGLRPLKRTPNYERMFPRSIPAALGSFIAAAGILFSALQDRTVQSNPLLSVACLLSGLLAVGALLLAGLCRYRGRRPNHVFHGVVTVYLLQEAFLFDNGPMSFYYDEHYNVAGYNFNDMEGQTIFTGHFAQPDANGMPSRYGTVWYDGSAGEDRILEWDRDGKLLEDRAGDAFTGTQYDYDEQGRLLERRDYYEGMLDSAVYYEYDGDTLSACWSEDSLCNKKFDCRVVGGRIVEQTFYDYSTPYGYIYEYDENGNLVRSTFVFDGEGLPGTQYTYIQVQVSPERAQYLREQQKYLMTLT